jgi:hypothetical protein
LNSVKPTARTDAFTIGMVVALLVLGAAAVTGVVLGALSTSRTQPDGPFNTSLLMKQDMLPMDDVIRVGPGRKYKTVTEVVNLFKQHHVDDLKIVVDPGTYAESYDFSGLVSHSYGFRVNGNRTQQKGLSIRGAEVRAIDGVTYIDDHPANDIAGMGIPGGHSLTTDAGVGPFVVYLSSDLLEMGGDLTYPFTAELVLANPLDACTPLTNDLTGKIGVAIRGGCAFTVKGQNMVGAGAVAHIMYNSNPGPIFLGGGEVMGGGPTYGLNGEDGPILAAALQSGTVTGTLTPPVREYEPPLGLARGVVDLIHPGGNLAQVEVVINSAPVNSPAEGLPAENPDFAAADVRPGDKIIFVCPDPDTTLQLFGFAPINENQHFQEEATVASVAANVITLTAPLTYNCSVPDSSMTFAPRVRVLGVPDNTGLPGPLLSVNGGGIRIRGIYFSQPDDTAFRAGDVMAILTTAHVEMDNVVFWDRSETYVSVLIYHSDLSTGVSGNDGVDGATVTGSNSAPVAIINLPLRFIGGRASGMYMSILGTREGSLDVREGSTVSMDSLQCIWSEELTIYETVGIDVDEGSLFEVDLLNLARHPFIGAFAGQGSSLSVLQYAYTRRNAQYAFGGSLVEWTSVFATRRGGTLSVNNFNGDDNDGQDVLSFEGSRASITGSYVSTNRRKTGAAFISTGPSTVDTATISSTPGNVFRYTNSTFVDNNYLTNVVVGSTPIALTLDPTEQLESFDFPDQYRFVGRTYTFIFEDAVPHTITLLNGAVFEGPGIPAGSNVITLNIGGMTMAPSSDHQCVTLEVISPSEVVICSGLSQVTPSTLAPRDVKAEKAPRMTMPPGAHRPSLDTLGTSRGGRGADVSFD